MTEAERIAELEAQVAALLAERDARFVPGPVPDAMVDGRHNPAHYQARLSNLNRLAEHHQQRTGDLIKGYKQMLDGILHEARRALGKGADDLIDNRSDAAKNAETAAILLAEPEDEIQKLATNRISSLHDAIEREMDFADDTCKDIITERTELAEANGSPWMPGMKFTPAMVDRGKAWLRCLRREMRLRDRARNPVPKCSASRDAVSLRAAHVLRFMIKVGRSQISTALSEADRVFKIGRHHCLAVVDLYEYKWGVQWAADGPKIGVKPYTGGVIVMPPRHGKTELAMHDAALTIYQHPSCQLIWSHHARDQAQNAVEYVSTCFNPKQPNGARALALFDGVAMAKATRTRGLRMKLKQKLKDQTLMPCGIKSAIAGANASAPRGHAAIIADDVVDQKEVDQESERENTYIRMTGTLLMRKAGGKQTFDITYCTLWHPDDANCRRIKAAAEGKIYVGVSIQACKGPEGDFKPLWPEMYDRDFLKQQYRLLGPTLYSCAYGANPEPEQTRVVRKVRYYAPLNPDGTPNDEHVRFLKTATRRLSIDPTASSKETSDKAGLLYLADGEVRMDDADDVFRTERRVRLLDAYEIHAGMTDVTEWVGTYGQRCPVDICHVECRSGYVAQAEMLENRWGIRTERYDPGNRDKLSRLKGCSNVLEDGLAEQGIRAVMEFPGVWNEKGELVCDPRFQWLVDEIEKFRTCPHKHGVDALTQVLNALAPDLGIGEGVITQQIRRTLQYGGVSGRPERFRERDKMIPRADRDKPPHEADLVWQLN